MGNCHIFFHINCDENDTFKRFAQRHNVCIQHYHADNGRFADTEFREHIRQCRQTITYCGVNAHFLNDVAERRIRLQQDRARTMLLHSKQLCPSAVEAYLWSYAFRLVNEIHNATPDILRQDLWWPMELFTESKVTPDLGHFRPFACPVYVIDNCVQKGGKIDKWEARSRMGLYLGTSLVHARSVALVLNLITGHVSPRFHIKFDPHFETVRAIGLPQTTWQRGCYFASPTTPRVVPEGGRQQVKSTIKTTNLSRTNEMKIIRMRMTQEAGTKSKMTRYQKEQTTEIKSKRQSKRQTTTD